MYKKAGGIMNFKIVHEKYCPGVYGQEKLFGIRKNGLHLYQNWKELESLIWLIRILLKLSVPVQRLVGE